VQNSFRKKNIDGVITYFHNGIKVSKEKFDKLRAFTEQKQTDLLGGTTIEDKRKQIQEKIASAKLKKKNLAPYKKGGSVNSKAIAKKYFKGGMV